MKAFFYEISVFFCIVCFQTLNWNFYLEFDNLNVNFFNFSSSIELLCWLYEIKKLDVILFRMKKEKWTKKIRPIQSSNRNYKFKNSFNNESLVSLAIYLYLLIYREEKPSNAKSYDCINSPIRNPDWKCQPFIIETNRTREE